MTVGKDVQEAARLKARKDWKKEEAHPGFTSTVHDLIERSFEAGFDAGVLYGLDMRGEPLCQRCKEPTEEPP